MIWLRPKHFGGAGGRYAIVPAMLLLSAALVIVDGAERRRLPFSRWLAISSVALLALGIAISFDVANKPARGTPSWSESLKTAGAACQAEGGPEALVAISPPGLGLYVSCGELPGGTNSRR